MYSIKKTINLGLCVSCEICMASCPEKAIEMKYQEGQFIPEVKNECTKCQVCLKLCPGIDIERFNFESLDNFEMQIIGNYLESYSAYSKNELILRTSSSGGLITTLIISLLEDKEVEGAFVLPFNKFNGQSVRLKLKKNPKDIMNAAKSKYIPASVYNIIKILQIKKNPNYVIVGTPCQIKGLKKYIKENNIDDDKIIFFGLFCDKTLNFNILSYFEDKYSKNGEKLVKIDFRNKEKDGWPGHPKLYFDTGKQIIIDRAERTKVKDYFQLERCLYCFDKFNRLSDISFGDCYIHGKSLPGRSNLIVRTEKGKRVFEKYKHLFKIQNSSIKSIQKSQGISEKKKNLDFINYFLVKNKSKTERKIKKRLRRRKKKIKLGKNYDFSKLKRAILLDELRNSIRNICEYFQIAIYTVFSIVMYFINDIIIDKKTSLLSKKNNIIIIGGNMANKGAQAMTFTLVDQIKKRFPNRDVYLFSNEASKRDEYEKEQYNFKIIPWPNSIYNQTKLSLLNFALFNKKTKNEYDLERIIQNSTRFIDISGYRLSSNFNFSATLDYLSNIMIAKKFNIPYFIFPQSMGPFDYIFLQKMVINVLLHIYLKYPIKIFIRENQGLKDIKKFTKKNIELRRDIVLTSRGYDINHIYKEEVNIIKKEIMQNSVGIIPNVKVLKSIDKNSFYSLYKLIINELINSRKTVYILRHSEEDLHICLNLKRLFKDNKNVKIISEDLNCIELEYIIRQFDFVIASRYHSIIHAYRNKIPALVIGWADKYNELLTYFSQEQFFYDFRDNIDKTKLISSVSVLINNYILEKKMIKEKMSNIKKTSLE